MGRLALFKKADASGNVSTLFSAFFPPPSPPKKADMPTVRNKTLIYTAQPTSFLVPGVHTKLEEREIDLDNAELYGGVLVKVLVLSSDPYMHYRMRDPSIESFCPPLHVGDMYVDLIFRRRYVAQPATVSKTQPLVV